MVQRKKPWMFRGEAGRGLSGKGEVISKNKMKQKAPRRRAIVWWFPEGECGVGGGGRKG